MTTDVRDPGELDAQPSAWIRTELESVSLGDERLSKRAFKIVECLAAQRRVVDLRARGRTGSRGTIAIVERGAARERLSLPT
jgi:hypothetical protein